MPCDSTFRDKLSSKVSSSLSSDQRASCEGLLSQEECWGTLHAMVHGKGPGSDGI